MAIDPLGASVGLDPSQPVAGLDPLNPDPNAPGPFKRGLKTGVADLKSIGGGLLQAAGRGFGAKPLEAAGVAIQEAAAAESAPYRMQVEDVGAAFDQGIVPGIDAGVDLVKYAIGSQIPMLATMLAGGLVGRGLGAVAARALPAASAARAGQAGAELGVLGASTGLEAGSIAPEALANPDLENPLARTAAGALAAGALDSIIPIALARRMGLLGGASALLAPRAAGVGAVAKEVGSTALKTGASEAATETAQSVIERTAAGQPLQGAEANSDYLNSSVMGAIMGSLTGGLAGGITSQRRSIQDSSPPPGGTQPPAPEQVLQNDITSPQVVQESNNVTPAPADIAAVHAAATQHVADLTTQLTQAQAAHDAAQGARDALNEELKKPIGERRTKSTLLVEKKARAAEIKQAKLRIEALGGELFAAKQAADSLAAQIAPVAPAVAPEPPTAVNPANPVANPANPAAIVPNKAPPTEAEVTQQAVAGAKAAAGEAPEAAPVTSATPSQVQTDFADLANATSGGKNTPARNQRLVERAMTAYHNTITEVAALPAEQARKVAETNARKVKGIGTEGREHFVAEVMKAHGGSKQSKGASTQAGKIADLDAQIKEATARYQTKVGEITALRAMLTDRFETVHPVSGKTELNLFPSDAAQIAQLETEASVIEGELARLGQTRVMVRQMSVGAVAPAHISDPNLIERIGQIEGGSFVRDHSEERGGIGKYGVKAIQRNYAELKAAGYDAEDLDNRVIYGNGGYNRYVVQANGNVVPDITSFDNRKDQLAKAKQILGDVRASNAALTQDQYDALPETAQHAALDAYNGVMIAKGTALRERLTQLIGPDANLVVKTFQANPNSPIGSFTRVDALKSVIAMALNAKDGLSVADHEGYHYAEAKLLSGSERRIVANALKPGRPLHDQLLAKVQQYDRANNTNLQDEVMSTPAEAHAYAFEFWRRGEFKVEGVLNRIWAKVQQFFERVANAVKGLGFRSMESVFTALDRGQFAERSRSETTMGGTFSSLSSGQRWYRSALTEAVAAMNTKAASAQGWKDQIKGLVAKGAVKQAEIDAVGLQEFLDLKPGKITKDSMMAFLGENGVQVEETMLGDVDWEKSAQDKYGKPYAELSITETADLRRSLEQDGGETIFNRPDLVLPGGANYRELLLTLPVSKALRVQFKAEKVPYDDSLGTYEGMDVDYVLQYSNAGEIARLKNGDYYLVLERDEWASPNLSELEPRLFAWMRQEGYGSENDFQSSHFNQPNILAHVRFNERTDADGKRVLFVEEFQSDWAQKGKKEGFALTDERKAELYTRRSAIEALGKEATPEQKQEWVDIMNELQPNRERTTPSAPFVGKTDAWVALAMKRMIAYAAQNGFDKVAWTTGEQQVERYKQALRKAVDRVEWTKTDKGVHLVGYKTDFAGREAAPLFINPRGGLRVESRRKVVDTTESESALSDAIGKAMADKIKNDPNQSGFIEGDDITISDTGMSGFYDKIVPSVANEVLKKLGGGRVGETNLGTEQKRDLYVTKTNASTWQIYDKLTDSWLSSGGHWVDSPVVAQEFRSESAATQQSMKLQALPDARIQPGFTITPELAKRAAEGLPLFSKGAVDTSDDGMGIALRGLTPAQRALYNQAAGKATADMERQKSAGELQQEQANDAGNLLLDQVQQSEPTWKMMMGGLSVQYSGGLTRWWQRNIATPNFASRFSKGYRNVFQTLNTYNRYSSVLIKQMLKEQMPEWYTASKADQDAAFKALTLRNVGRYTMDAPEMMEVLAPLTPAQRGMFNSATKMVEGFLRKELEVDKVFYRGVYNDEDYAKWLTNRETQVQDLIAHGYEPLERFGDHTVTVFKTFTDAKGRSQPLSAIHHQFESAAAAHTAAEVYKAELARMGSDMTVEVGFKHKTVRDGTISIQQFLDTARRNGVPLTQAETERIVKALTASDSIVRNRMLRRKDVPGYSKDGMRVLNSFGVKMSGKIAYAGFATAIDAAAAGRQVTSDLIPRVKNGTTTMEPQILIDDPQVDPATGETEGKDSFEARNLWKQDGPMGGFYRNLADELSDYVLVPDHTGEWSRKLRAAAMMYFIGGSISGAMVNVMSIPMLLVPQLSVHTNYATGAAAAMSAWKLTWQHQAILRDIVKLKDFETHKMPGIDEVPGLRRALIVASEDGRTMDTEIHQITGMAQGAMFSQSRTVQKAMEVWMAPFRLTEQTNRITSFIAAYKVASSKEGVKWNSETARPLTGQDLYRFAGEMVDATQNNYQAANRPGAARHPLYAMLFMFKSFPLFMTEAIALMYKANPRSAIYMLLGLTAMTGVQGLPFAETLMDIIDTISQRLFGSPFNTRRAMRNVIKSASEAFVGYDASELVLRGVINQVTGMSVSSRIGAGDFVPGSRLGTADGDQGRVLGDLLGAPFSMVKEASANIGGVVGSAATGDWKGMFDALQSGGPIAVRNVLKGAEQLSTGYASDTKGRRIEDVNGMEGVLQLFGFAPAKVAAAYEHDRIIQQVKAFHTQVSADMQAKLVSALKDGDTAAVQDVFALRDAWNAQYPEMPIIPSATALRRSMMLSGMTLPERTLRMLGRRGQGIAADDGGL